VQQSCNCHSAADLDKGMQMYIHAQAHKKLAIHTISHATMTREQGVKVLDAKCTLKARGKETTEGSNGGGEEAEPSSMKLHRNQSDGCYIHSEISLESLNDNRGERICSRRENGIGNTVKLANAEILLGAGEPLELRKELSEEETENNCEETSTNEALPSFVGGKGQERTVDNLFAKQDATEIGHNVVEDDQAAGQQEPDQTIEDVFNDNTRLSHNHNQSHEAPSTLQKLVLVVTRLQGENESNETYAIQSERE